MKMKQLTLGTDLEGFLRNRRTGIIESAIPIIPEGKENPRSLGDGFGIQHDNVLVEFQVPPSKNKKEFVRTLREGLKRVSGVLGKEYEFVAQASHKLNKKYLKHMDANVFGCSAEYDAWEKMEVRPPDCRTNLRSCGGHIHIGRADWENPDNDILIDPYSKMRVICLMDIFVGIPFTILENNDPTNKERKKLYGRSSFHRPTPFGCEYRVLTNYWARSPQLAELALDLAMLAVRAEVKGKSNRIIQSVSSESVISTINRADKRDAKKMLRELPIPARLKERVLNFEKKKFPTVLEKEWKLNK